MLEKTMEGSREQTEERYRAVPSRINIPVSADLLEQCMSVFDLVFSCQGCLSVSGRTPRPISWSCLALQC